MIRAHLFLILAMAAAVSGQSHRRASTREMVLLRDSEIPRPTSKQLTEADNPTEHAEMNAQILQVERETMEAIKQKNAARLNAILADDFIHRSAGGPDTVKADFIKGILAIPVTIMEIWGDELKIAEFGDVAVLTGVQRVKTRDATGKEEAGANAFTDVFVKRSRKWRMVLAYSVELAGSIK